MTKVEKIILRAHEDVMGEKGLYKKSSRDLRTERENGIDSLGIVNLVLAIEEKLNIELDEYLVDIRQCKTIGEIIDIVEEGLK